MFMPWNFSSQPRKELSRTTRSITSTYNTVDNFSMNDLLKRLTRIELLNYIQNGLGADLDDDNLIKNKIKEKVYQNQINSYLYVNKTIVKISSTNLLLQLK